jgi:hypothetical protein
LTFGNHTLSIINMVYSTIYNVTFDSSSNGDLALSSSTGQIDYYTRRETLSAESRTVNIHRASGKRIATIWSNGRITLHGSAQTNLNIGKAGILSSKTKFDYEGHKFRIHSSSTISDDSGMVWVVFSRSHFSFRKLGSLEVRYNDEGMREALIAAFITRNMGRLTVGHVHIQPEASISSSCRPSSSHQTRREKEPDPRPRQQSLPPKRAPPEHDLAYEAGAAVRKFLMKELGIGESSKAGKEVAVSSERHGQRHSKSHSKGHRKRHRGEPRRSNEEHVRESRPA